MFNSFTNNLRRYPVIPQCPVLRTLREYFGLCGLFKKQKTCTVFLLSYGNTSGTLGKMLWEHKS